MPAVRKISGCDEAVPSVVASSTEHPNAVRGRICIQDVLRHGSARILHEFDCAYAKVARVQVEDLHFLRRDGTPYHADSHGLLAY